MEYFPILKHRSDEIRKFIASCGIVSLLLKSGKVIHFFPDDPEHFIQWLSSKGIKNIKEEKTNRSKREAVSAL